MELSYSNALIKFNLRNYIDISSGNFPKQKAVDAGFLKSVGRNNPNETWYVWIADIQEAIEKLNPGGLWKDMCQDIGFESMRANLYRLLPVQRYLVKNCIFGECYWCRKMLDCPTGKDKCTESWAISKMRRILNGEIQQQEAGNTNKEARLSVLVDNLMTALSRANRKAKSCLTAIEK